MSLMSATCLADLFRALWKITRGDERIRIAILDGPVDRTHRAFGLARLSEIDGTFAARGASRGLATEHGTYVASLIFGQHDGPIKGIAPRCSGLLVPVFGNSSNGTVLTCTQLDLARAIAAAVDRGARIINISGGAFTSSGTVDPVLEEVLDRCDRQGVLIVAAAGNDGCDCLHVPAAHPSILAVGAATARGEALASSNWGAQYQGHGILAIGDRIRGAAPGDSVVERSGTSAATAIVSGAAGLLMSLEAARGIDPDGPRVRQLLLKSADPCPHVLPSNCLRYLSGVLNVDRAVSFLSKRDITMSVNDPNPHLQFSSTNSDVSRTTEGIDAWGTRSQPLREQVPVNTSELVQSSASVSPLAEIRPAACVCGGGRSSTPEFVFTFGKIGIAFSNRARFESIQQHMGKAANPSDPVQVLKYLEDHQWDATSIIWTLTLEEVPIYAISVAGPNSGYVVERLTTYLRAQQTEKIDRVAVAGVLGGRVGLMSGELLPVIHPELRGMSSWKIDALVGHAKGTANPPKGKKAVDIEATQPLSKQVNMRQFLDRVYFERRNLGLTPRDRAINYIATIVSTLDLAFEDAEEENMQLHSIDATPSLVSRLGSDCWDVKLEYFFRGKDTATERKVYRVAVDVSDVVPVTVGKLRHWPSAD